MVTACYWFSKRKVLPITWRMIPVSVHDESEMQGFVKYYDL